jgi:hypothetical protein
MEQTTKMRNSTKETIHLSMDNAPGQPPTVYEVEPGKTCEVPTKYVDSGAIARLAPGLVKDDKPKKPAAKKSEPKKAKTEDKPAKKKTGLFGGKKKGKE